MVQRKGDNFSHLKQREVALPVRNNRNKSSGGRKSTRSA